ncbi:MAG: hypothetical protein MMC33_007606 [Icmadophila ericetorum]|nr:hypothetical protein [Icmadophila ericetorum]
MAHLDSQTLDGPNVQDILGDLGMWLANKVFTKEGSDLERYVANDLESKIIPLLRVLNFVNKSSRPGYTVLRTTGVKSAKIRNSTGPAYLIPIRILSGNPMVSTKQAKVGEAIYITEQVDVGPKMDFIIIVPSS